jgi:hypothetical protein
MVTLTKGRVKCIGDDNPGRVGQVYNILEYNSESKKLAIEWERGWDVRSHYPTWKEHLDKYGYWVCFDYWKLVKNEYGCRSMCEDCTGKCDFFEKDESI